MGRRVFKIPGEREDLVQRVLQLHTEGLTQHQIAIKAGLSQPTVHVWLKRYGPPKVTLQQHIAEKIRAELVCCDIYQRMEDANLNQEVWKQLRHSNDYHAICFYGEWSARIAERTSK